MRPISTRLSVVIPTLGDRATLGMLLRSIEVSEHPVDRVVVVLQRKPSPVVAAQLGESYRFVVDVVRAEPGVAGARNAGVAALGDQWDVVAFADDDVQYRDGAIRCALREIEAGASVVSGRCHLPDGRSRVRFPPVATDLDRRSIWFGAMESTLFVSKEAWRLGRGFDRRLGLGADTPWQSGEGQDFLLRVLAAGLVVRYDPRVEIVEAGPERAMGPRDVRSRARRYARGTGRVYATHYGTRSKAWFLIRSAVRVAVGLRHLSFDRLLLDVGVLVGRVEGMVGRTWGVGR